jgi:hypothetical protein
MQRVYGLISLVFLLGGAVLFVGGEVSAAVGDDPAFATFVVNGFPGCLFFGIGLVLGIFWAGEASMSAEHADEDGNIDKVR